MKNIYTAPDGKKIPVDWGFVSGRINFLLDLSGNYSPVNAGRALEVAREFGWGKSTVQMIIAPSSNYLPKRDNLRTLVEQCLLRVNCNHPLESVVMWVEHASAPNPFTGAPGKVDHRLLAKVYLQVDVLSKELNFDIDRILSQSELEELYAAIFRIKTNEAGCIDANVIREILKAWSKKCSPLFEPTYPV